MYHGILIYWSNNINCRHLYTCQSNDYGYYRLHTQQLLAYTPVGAAALRKNDDKMPMILSGNFNVNFASNDSVLLVNILIPT